MILQNLLKHTVSPIIQAQNEIITTLMQDASKSSKHLSMTCNGSSDGSGSQRNYRHICEDDKIIFDLVSVNKSSVVSLSTCLRTYFNVQSSTPRTILASRYSKISQFGHAH